MVLPTILFVVPAMAGHPAIAQDNFIQNFPLRVLSGQQIAGGHLPLFNSLANSGTPLLGGMNAGSFYPMSLVFVILPALVAWVLNLIVVYVVAALGLYSLCRWLGLRSSAALLASLVFAYAGAMMGQMVHLGVVEGYSLLPWLVLTELAAARSLLSVGDGVPWRSQVVESLPAVVGFGLIWGLTFLSGEPRAIAEAELVSLIVIAVEMIVHSGVERATWRGRGLFVGANVVGAAWGAAIALVQLLPGWAFISQSERSNEGYNFFGSGSLAVKWSALLFNQQLLGGNGVLGTPKYFAGYNLAEVTGYVGLVALVGTFAFFAQVTSRGWRGPNRSFTVFAVFVLVGLFAAWGYFTPVGHLFHLLPLFGKTRLQSRNIVVLDLGATVLMAWFLDAVFSRRRADASLVGWRRAVTLAPAAVTVGIALVVLVWPTSFERWLGVLTHPSFASRESLTVAISLILAAGVVVALSVRASATTTRRLIVAVVLADLIMFNLLSDVGFATGSTSTMPSRAGATAVLGTTGRYAIVDPTQVNFGVFEQLGVPNLNVFTQLPSVQGYGSLVSANYSEVTGTHPLVALNRCNLQRGVFAPLRLNTLVLSWSALSHEKGTIDTLPACTPPVTTPTASRYFGRELTLSRLVLRVQHTPATPAGAFVVHLLGRDGQDIGTSINAGTGPVLRVRVVNEPPAAGFRVSGPYGVRLADTQVVTTVNAHPQTLLMNGAYQDVVSSSAWRLTTTTDDYAVFTATSLLPPQWLEGAAATAAITAHRSASWGDEWITVHTPARVTLVRSVAWLSGWRADLVNQTTGATESATVRVDGLIQKISVPAGTWVIHFHYHAPYVELGLLVSIAASLLFVVAVFVIVRPRVKIWRRGRVNR